MSEPTKAVFLSYASQDAEAAKRIADALRGAGVEVWFDSEGGLEHGDEWDAKIRRQIKECVLFIPIISANTEAREEGYFRIEWELAAQRALGIASGVAFILPVVIDGTKEQEALVPDRFRSVQWTKLPGGSVPPDVLQRFLKLWSHRAGMVKHADNVGASLAVPSGASGEGRDAARGRGQAAPLHPTRPHWKIYAALAIACLVIAAGAVAWLARKDASPSAPISNPKSKISNAPPAPPPVSEARQLVAKAHALFESLDTTRDDYKLAEEIVAQAKVADGNDAEVWAAEAQLHSRFIQRGWDTSDARRESARAATQRAQRLDPQSFEARFAQAALLGYTGREGTDKEKLLRELHRERPADHRVLRDLGSTIERQGRADEGIAFLDEAAALPGGDPLALYNKSLACWFAGRTAEAQAALRAAIAQKPFTGALLVDVWYAIVLRGDLDEARATLEKIPAAELLEDRGCFFAFFLHYVRRKPGEAIEQLRALPRDWINDSWYRGPKGHLMGDALQLAGRSEAAAVEWRAALKLVDARLAAGQANHALQFNRVLLLAKLGEKTEAKKEFEIMAQLRGLDLTAGKPLPVWVTDIWILLGRKTEAINQIALGLQLQQRAVSYTAALLRLDPIYDPLRNEPEFAKVLAQAEALERPVEAKPTIASGATTFSASSDKASATAEAMAKADQKSVAVLAFANLSDDKANEYFSDGISEELLNVLAKVPGLKVSARTSAFYFKGKEVPIPEIAKQLGVAYVVEGSVRKSGDKVRITAQLIKAADGFHVWSDTFTRDLKDIFAVQDEIAGLIAKNLELKMGMVAARPTVDLEAYQEYLTGRALVAKARNEELREAVRHFEKAVAIEPKFTAAWAQLASAHTQLGRWGGAPTRQAWAAARNAIDKARELEPDSPDVLLALGWILRTADWNWRGAEQAYRRAMELRPNHADTLSAAAVLLFNVGRKEEALRLGRQAVELDPLNAATQIDLSLIFYFSEEWVAQEKLARRAIQLAPAGDGYRGLLAYSLIGQRRFAEAVAEAGREPDEVSSFSALGLLAVEQGQAAVARTYRQQLKDLYRTRGDTADLQLGIASISAGLGDRDDAFAALEIIRASRDAAVSWLRNDIYLRPLHADPRWDALLHQVGLADDQLK